MSDVLRGSVPESNVPTDDPAGIELRQVTKTYGEGVAAVHALRELDFTVSPGEFVVILGPSGSGKTTLLNVIGGIERPSSGSVRVAGRDVASLSEAELTSFRRRRVGFVFQFFNLIPTLTALENVSLVLELTGTPDSEAEALAALALVGLGDQADRFPGQLSGGQQQRVAIARAIAKEPDLLLCDEPTGELDLETGRVVLRILERLNREASHTVLLVTHNSAIAPMAGRVVRMRSGRIASEERNASPVGAGLVSW